MDLKIVEQTWETVKGQWIYRIREVKDAEWRAGRFPATMISRSVYFKTVEEAVAVIEQHG